MATRHIIFIPGINPKPPADEHRALLWRTLLEGVRRADVAAANNLQAHYAQFHLVSWNQLFYHEQKDISKDMPWVEALLGKPEATAQDIRDANAIKIKINRAALRVVDQRPFLLQLLPERSRKMALDLERYFNNTDQVASSIRDLLKQTLQPILEKNEPVLIIGHSMGSIIAYDTLWEMSQQQALSGKVDFMTLGSPLGMHYIQHRLLGWQSAGSGKYPSNIRKWINVAAEGDLAALNGNFSRSFKAMLDLRLLKSIEDHNHGVYNFFRNEDGLNSHRSSGYLVNPVVGRLIADWWSTPENYN